MSLAPGTKLGAHEIVELIGEGGMGQVYRARDSSLGRDVAVKVLPEVLAADAERVGRFRREAQLLAALTHQNVAAIHGFDDDGDRHYLVMELVEGEPLDRRLRQGPLETTAALEVARQVAEGLEAAHAKGIVHRDLKPGNVIVKPDGQVKVLDFGLAKALSDAPESSSALGRSPTLITAETAQGVLLGTAAYMSPEQARGQSVDARSDNWAFGALLFEMLSGKRAFEGDTVSDCLASVLQGEPDWSALPGDTPPAVRLLLRRCLTKDARRRLHSIADARIEIESVLADPAGSTAMLSAAAEAAGRGSRGLAPIAAAGLALLAALVGAAAAWSLLRPEPAERRVERFVLTLDDPDLGSGQSFAPSPDGRSLAYVQERTDRLAVLSFETAEITVLPGVHSGFVPEYGADGEWIFYFSESPGEVRRVPARGGPSKLLLEDPGWVLGLAADRDGGLFVSHMKGGPPAALTHVPPGEAEPRDFTGFGEFEAYLPALTHDGAVLFAGTRPLAETVRGPSAERSTIRAFRREDGRVSVVLEGATAPQWSPSGHLVAVGSGGLLTAVPFDPEAMEVTGPPVVVEEPVTLVRGWVPTYSIGRDGTLVYQAAGSADLAPLSWLDLEGRLAPMGLPPELRTVEEGRLSPDGALLALTDEGGRNGELWVVDPSTGDGSRLGDHELNWDHPAWSADGRQVFAVLEPDENERPYSLWRFTLDFTRPPEQLHESERHLIALDATPDGRALLFAGFDASWQSRETRVSRLDLSTGAVTTLFETPRFCWRARVSPDGRWLATLERTDGASLVFVRPLDGAGEPVTVTSARQAGLLGWTPDSRGLVFTRGALGVADFLRAPLTTEPELAVGESEVLLEDRASPWHALDYDPRNERFLWLGDLESAAHRVVLVRNFDEHLRRVAPPTR